MERVQLFEITDGDKCYRIYSDGYLEGFSESAKVINSATYLIKQIAYYSFIAGKSANNPLVEKCRTVPFVLWFLR
jgi:hypothetical protein